MHTKVDIFDEFCYPCHTNTMVILWKTEISLFFLKIEKIYLLLLYFSKIYLYRIFFNFSWSRTMLPPIMTWPINRSIPWEDFLIMVWLNKILSWSRDVALVLKNAFSLWERYIFSITLYWKIFFQHDENTGITNWKAW